MNIQLIPFIFGLKHTLRKPRRYGRVLSRAPKNKNLTSKIYVVVQLRVDPTESN
jgi:hypothetical protein